MSVFTGSAVALITPFTDDFVNVPELKRILDFQMDEGTDAILVCGTTGEPATMSDKEKHTVISESIAHINRKVPVIVGTGSNSTAHAIIDSKFAEAEGADAILVVTPYYNKCSQEGLKKHFFAIADSVSIPIIMYNVPARTGVNILPQTLAEIAEHENIAGIKEASGDISQVAEMARLCEGKLDLYSGNDDMTIPLMSLGGKGVISVLANVAPRAVHEMTYAYLDGNIQKACSMQLKYNVLVNALFSDVNPIPVKMAMGMMGFEVGELRLPLTEMGGVKKQALFDALKEFNLIP